MRRKNPVTTKVTMWGNRLYWPIAPVDLVILNFLPDWRWSHYVVCLDPHDDCGRDGQGTEVSKISHLGLSNYLDRMTSIRATIFFQLQAIELASELIAPPIGSLLMGRNLWSPMFVGLAIQSAGIGITLIMPETREFFKSIKYKDSSDPTEIQPILSSDNEDADTPLGKMPSRLKDYREALTFFQDWNIFLLLLTFLICIIGQRSIQLLLQYVSKRYGWTLAHVRPPVSTRAFSQQKLIRQDLCV